MDSVIQVNQFTKSFGGKKVHRGVSFELRKGECLGLLGGSGVGKSVILRSLIGLEKPDQGEIHIGPDEISRWTEEQLVPIRKKVAYVFQNGALFDSMSVFDNLAYPLREHTRLSETEIEKKVLALLVDFDLEGTGALFPAELSGGMQKRVGLARSIILEPEVVLYDEPTAGLDPRNTIMIQKLIIKLQKRGVSSIFVTHDMPSAVAVCDRFVLLKKGEVAARGTLEELKKDKNGPLRRFVEGEQI